jgi:hypothetical protein
VSTRFPGCISSRVSEFIARDKDQWSGWYSENTKVSVGRISSNAGFAGPIISNEMRYRPPN